MTKSYYFWNWVQTHQWIRRDILWWWEIHELLCIMNNVRCHLLHLQRNRRNSKNDYSAARKPSLESLPSSVGCDKSFNDKTLVACTATSPRACILPQIAPWSNYTSLASRWWTVLVPSAGLPNMNHSATSQDVWRPLTNITSPLTKMSILLWCMISMVDNHSAPIYG